MCSLEKNGAADMNWEGSVTALRDAGNAAVGTKDFKKACHLYTLALDSLANTHGLARDESGRALPAHLYGCNQSSGGILGKLLSNRSLTHLRLGDGAAALDDAVACVHADPSFEKGHLRVFQALQAQNASHDEQLEAVKRGIAACPEGELLQLQEKRLRDEAAAREQQQQQQQPPCTPPHKTKPGNAGDTATKHAEDVLAETKRVAEDPQDPRHFMAAGDLGAALAVGAHGAPRDVERAETYLRRGAQGDVVAKRNLGLLLIETGRAAEAAPFLNDAAQSGDEEAMATLAHLCQEAEAKQLEAREKLIEMASAGDPRAAEMLRELSM